MIKKNNGRGPERKKTMSILFDREIWVTYGLLGFLRNF